MQRLRKELVQNVRPGSDVAAVSREKVIQELRGEFISKYSGKRQDEMRERYSKNDRNAYNPYIRFVNDLFFNP